jgi:queuine/archaeosine tRNA-ribosyltransferase
MNSEPRQIEISDLECAVLDRNMQRKTKVEIIGLVIMKQGDINYQLRKEAEKMSKGKFDFYCIGNLRNAYGAYGDVSGLDYHEISLQPVFLLRKLERND